MPQRLSITEAPRIPLTTPAEEASLPGIITTNKSKPEPTQITIADIAAIGGGGGGGSAGSIIRLTPQPEGTQNAYSVPLNLQPQARGHTLTIGGNPNAIEVLHGDGAEYTVSRNGIQFNKSGVYYVQTILNAEWENEYQFGPWRLQFVMSQLVNNDISDAFGSYLRPTANPTAEYRTLLEHGHYFAVYNAFDIMRTRIAVENVGNSPTPSTAFSDFIFPEAINLLHGFISIARVGDINPQLAAQHAHRTKTDPPNIAV